MSDTVTDTQENQEVKPTVTDTEVKKPRGRKNYEPRLRDTTKVVFLRPLDWLALQKEGTDDTLTYLELKAKENNSLIKKAIIQKASELRDTDWKGDEEKVDNIRDEFGIN